MKKSICFIIIASIIMTSFCILGACDKDEGWQKVKVADTNLYSDNEYIDYAEEVYFDLEKYPDLTDTGLFWTKWDEETKSIIQIPADSEEGAALIDPNKPTLINVHGMLTDGHYKQETFNLNKKIANPLEFDLDTEDVSMVYLWLREGWNVGNYHYNKFASEISPKVIEEKIWSIEGKSGVRYRHENGDYESHISEYCLAEHFAADYIRAMNYLPDTMGSKEIRFASHSMGGQLTTAGIFLLTELSNVGQLDKSKLPDRNTLLDPYFSTTKTIGSKVLYMGPENINIRWSDKKIVSNNTGITMLECLKDLEANGIALEYYTNDDSFLKLGMANLVEEFKTLTTYSIVYPNWSGNGYSILTDGHNGVREWYLCSIIAPPVKDITNGENSEEICPSASMATDKLKALKGTEYKIVDGTTTVNASDDTMIRTHSIYYVLNDGTNSINNVDYYSILTQEITIYEPLLRDGYVFDGWYDNPEFKGDKITSILTNKNKKITLYAKWIEK